MTYSDKLKSPKWQKKRLEIMSRDKFTCQCCGDKELQLNVHHKKYRKGAEIWDYPNDQLITMCANCHTVYHEIANGDEEAFCFKVVYHYSQTKKHYTGIAFIDGTYFSISNSPGEARVQFLCDRVDSTSFSVFFKKSSKEYFNTHDMRF